MSQRHKAVITGASSGIGRATALRFAREGWDICATARRNKELQTLYNTLPPGEHIIFAADYSNPVEVASLGQKIADAWASVDVLVNCAGISIPYPIIESPLEEWRKVFDVMVNGAILTTRMVVPLMKSGGRIIHITSIHGERAEMGSGSYGMAKAAINQFCRALALELAPANILVNAIAPGFIRTPMSVVNGVNELDTEWFRANYVEGNHLPLRRAGRPEEIAGVAFFLAGEDASYITGQVITVDGGLTITF